uniref:Uncharacterized protein n=1 Tax=Sphenodon punctatus TaxID=8508 RepID=A0A8D0HUY7_SPHPU
MADLDHNLSLADALSDPPPQIEEEVKRDFIATLEAEKFDDVVGETVGKTDYIPLLDDDDAKAGNQDPKSKPHAEGIQVDRSSAAGSAVLENGDHGIKNVRKVSPGKIMDEKISYKEFLDRNETWTMDDRDLRLDSQPVFKPIEATEPFQMHQDEVLTDLLMFPHEMTNVPPHPEHFEASKEVHGPFGAAVTPEQHFWGSPYSPGAFDPSAFMAMDLSAESLQNQSARGREMLHEEQWLGAQHPHLVVGPSSSLFEQSGKMKRMGCLVEFVSGETQKEMAF